MNATDRTFPAHGAKCAGDHTRWLGINRSELIAALFTLTIANALLPALLHGLIRNNPIYSIASLFGISVIVWAAIVIAGQLSLEETPRSIMLREKIAAVIILLASLLPIGPISWIIATVMALYLIVSEPLESSTRRSAWVYLALTFPMFWSKRIFNVLAEYFLSFDAILVSSITQTDRVSNLVAMPSGNGFLEIAPRCSSMANVSLAILCWVLFTQTRKIEWRPANIFWCGSACLAVISINVTRISLIGFFPDYYELLHDDVGSTVTNWLTVAAVFIVCNHGARRAPINAI